MQYIIFSKQKNTQKQMQAIIKLYLLILIFDLNLFTNQQVKKFYQFLQFLMISKFLMLFQNDLNLNLNDTHFIKKSCYIFSCFISNNCWTSWMRI